MSKKNAGAPLHGAPTVMGDPSREQNQYTADPAACQGFAGKAKPSYWAVLPAVVRYDEALPPNAKLLYAEISSLTDRTGYCYASNAYFEGLFGLSERTVIRQIKALEAAGYIVVEDATGGSALRKIFAGVNPVAGPPDKNVSTPCQNRQGGTDKNVTQNSKANSLNNQSPHTPQRGRSKKWKETADWKSERFEAFWKYYPRGENRQAAIRAWDKLRPSDELISVIARSLKRQMATEDWQNGIAIPYASTYLNNARWTDRAKKPLPAPQPAAEEVTWL